jgi:streptogramin lyase
MVKRRDVVCAAIGAAGFGWITSPSTGKDTAWGYTIDTVAGNGQPGAFSAAGGSATEVPVDLPFGVENGPDGALYITTVGTHQVLRLDPKTGRLSAVAGTGKKGYTGDGGKALDATFDGPKEIDIDKDGNVYVVDTENEAIRRIDARSGVVTTVAGKGRTKTPGLGDGGAATGATLGRPHGVAVGPDDALYIADTNSHRIRRVK